MRRLAILGTLLMIALPALIAAPASALPSHPATYTGTVAGGGSVEFDVSADGSAVTRFKITDVPTECGTISTQLTGSVPIQNDSFSHPTGPLIFSGSFPSIQHAQGTLQFKWIYPPCTSSVISWSATTTAPPPKDTTPPAIALSGKTKQKAGKRVVVTVSSNEAARIRATGSVKVPGARRYILRAASARIVAGGRAQLRLVVSNKALRAIRKALRNHQVVKAVVAVTARDAAGNKTTKRRTIRLR